LKDVFLALSLSGFMGLVGQGARAIIGLHGASGVGASGPGQQSPFSAAYLLVSLMIGAIAGVLAGLAIGLNQVIAVNADNVQTLLGIMAAGYAGADFIESAFSRLVPNISTNQPPPQVGAGQAGTPTLPTPAPDAQIAALGSAVDVLSNALVRATGQTPAATPAAIVALPGLATALHSVAPLVNATTWVPALNAGFTRFDLSSNKRMAAAIGQFLVEAGSGFHELAENMNYTHTDRLVAVFPSRIPNEAAAAPYVNNPEALGNFVYANRLGNGDEASGDGYRFRGRGLIQLTGRTEYSQFAQTIGKTVEEAAAYCETPEGAAVSGCWYLSTRGCLPLADSWDIDEITRRVNGAAMLGASQRRAFSDAMLKALGG